MEKTTKMLISRSAKRNWVSPKNPTEKHFSVMVVYKSLTASGRETYAMIVGSWT